MGLQGKTSHKSVDASENWFMYKYYTDRKVLFCMVAGNELFYSSLYLLHFTPHKFLQIIAVITFPVAVAKLAVAVLQGYLAVKAIPAIDKQERIRVKTN